MIQQGFQVPYFNSSCVYAARNVFLASDNPSAFSVTRYFDI